MNISRKLIILACSSVSALLLVGGVCIYAITALTSSLDFVNKKTVPSIELLYKVKSDQQLMAIIQFKYIQSDNAAQKAEMAQDLEKLSTNIRKTLASYEPMLRTSKGRELFQAEQSNLDEYLTLTASFFEKSRAGDIAGAMVLAGPAGAKRAQLSKLLDEHIELNGTNAEKAAVKAENLGSNAEMFSISLILLMIMVISVISFFVIRGINRSLASIQQAVTRIEGELDFTVHADVHGHDEIAIVSKALNRLIDKLRSSFASISNNALKIAGASTEMATAAEQVAAASTQQSDSASSMAASVEEMTVSIAHVSARSSEAHNLSKESGKLASNGIGVIGKTVEDINAIENSVKHVSTRIQELEDHSNRISSIVSVIKEVAEQTNLLALNAAIEAARAGEQGRGFAVVADEVRKLAERTSGSTKEISSMIDSIRAVSHDAVESMGHAVELVETGVQRASDASDAIQQIGHGSEQAVHMVEEITHAIREQSEASNNIAGNVEKIAQMAEESSAAAQNTAVAARELDHLARAMRETVSAYKL